VKDLIDSAGADKTNQTVMIQAVSWLANRDGGLMNLVRSFNESGLGHIVSSWIGSGPNLPVSTEQIKEALGENSLSELAGKAGLDSEKAATYLSSSLPLLVDALTPHGTMGTLGDLRSRGREILAEFVARKQGS
jgi:uncharacterized protein YidB (DUF937 family)